MLPAWRPLVRRGAGLFLSVAIAGTWLWPVTGPIEHHFSAPATPYAAGHRGIDVMVSDGTEVRAPEAGIVHFAGWVVDRPLVSLRHDGAVLSSFEAVEPAVTTGDIVARGQVIGHVIASPATHCTEACLHLGVRVAGDYVNPLLYLGGVPWSVLYPPAA